MPVSVVEMEFLLLKMDEPATSSTVMNLRVISYNSRGPNDSRKIYLENLLLKSDLLFLQEHGLADAQLDVLRAISHPHHFVCGVSGFDSLDVLRGRPFEGCVIF